MNACERCRELLEAVLLGQATSQETAFVRAHLPGCPDCRAQAQKLQGTLDALLHAAPALTPPPQLRARLLASAAATPPARPAQIESGQTGSAQTRPAQAMPVRPRRLWPALGLAAALGAGLLTAGLLRSVGGNDTALRRADLVVAAGPQLVVATSGTQAAPITIRQPGGRLVRVALTQPQPAWYTAGVYDGGRAYLLDAANSRVLVLNLARARLEGSLPAPGGAAGLAVLGGRVFVKTATSAELLVFGEGSSAGVASFRRTLARPIREPMPPEACMDAILPLGGRLYVTQHTGGQVFALSADGRRTLATYRVGGAPVALRDWQGQLLVLDLHGRLLALDSQGRLLRELKVPGTPDRMSVMHGSAYLTDRGGAVTVIDLKRFVVTGRRTFGKPMDIAALPDGHLALADAERGLLMLNADLSVLAAAPQGPPGKGLLAVGAITGR